MARDERQGEKEMFMTDTRFAILEALHNNPLNELHQRELYNIDPEKILQIHDDLKRLVDFDCIKKIPNSKKYKLTRTGRIWYLQHFEFLSEQKKLAKEEVEERKRVLKGYGVLSRISGVGGRIVEVTSKRSGKVKTYLKEHWLGIAALILALTALVRR